MMNILKRILPVKDNTVTIHLPQDFNARMVEVVILPYVPEEPVQSAPATGVELKKTVSPIYSSSQKFEKIIINGRKIS